MTPKQINKYNALIKRREQLANFIYVSDLPIFTSNEILLEVAVEQAKKTIMEIDNEIAKL